MKKKTIVHRIYCFLIDISVVSVNQTLGLSAGQLLFLWDSHELEILDEGFVESLTASYVSGLTRGLVIKIAQHSKFYYWAQLDYYLEFALNTYILWM